VKLFGNEDEAWRRTPPEERFSFRVPGEDTLSVGRDKTLRGEIASYGKQTVRFGKIRVGKEDFMWKLENRHALLSFCQEKERNALGKDNRKSGKKK
jgi:hypothetical protein